jgi:hypothetical protein
MNTFRVKNFEKFQHYKDRAPPWIKLYNGLLEDYEFGGLPDASKMHLIAIWLLASRTGNKMPYDPKWVSGRINATEPVDLELLVSRGFIVLDQEVQKAERVASKPPAERLTREEGQVQDIGKRKEESRTPSAPSSSDAFKRFKAAYPRRDGANPWHTAEKKFSALVKTGVDAEAMIAAAAALAREECARGNIGTKFIPQAITWLNQQRFQDYAAASFSSSVDDGLIEVLGEEELAAWDAHARAEGKKSYPRNSRGGWRFPSRYPPGYVPSSSAGIDRPPAPSLRSM